MWHLVVLMLCFLHAPVKFINDRIAPGSPCNLSFAESYLRKKIIQFSSKFATNDSIHHRNHPLFGETSAASSNQLSYPCTPDRTPNRPNAGPFPNRNEPNQFSDRKPPCEPIPRFPTALDYLLLQQPINEPHTIIKNGMRYHKNDYGLEGKPFVYDPKDLETITDRLIWSLPPNQTTHDIQYLEGMVCALITKNVNVDFNRFSKIPPKKALNLIIFSGEKSIVDPFTLVLPPNYDLDSNMIQHENEGALRYLAMFYNHTISAFRPGIMELVTKINEIGRETQQQFEILHYCQPMQYEKCLMYAMMIQLYYEEILGGSMEFLSFRVISTPQKSLRELQKMRMYFRDLAVYRKIFVMDHRSFDVSLYAQKSMTIRLSEFRVNITQRQQRLRQWVNVTQDIGASSEADTELYRVQSVLERYFKVD